MSISTDVSSVTVRRGSGNRTPPFGAATNYPATKSALSQVPNYPHSFTLINGLLLADLDADGRMDLVTSAAKGLVYWLGRDGGRFEAQAPLDAVGMGIPLAAGDWNGDGFLDLVYTDWGNETGMPMFWAPTYGKGHLHYRLGRGDGTFGADTACALFAGIVGDMDHDHRPDLLNQTHMMLGMDSCRANKLVPLTDWPQSGSTSLLEK